MKKVAVFGAKGLLGSCIVHDFRNRPQDYDVLPFDRATVDITDERAVIDAVKRARPSVIINCAAYNAVDAAEDHPLDALRVNAFAVRSLARAAVAVDATLVHYGSDFVFDGTGSTPYTEEVTPNPRSTYAASKMLGEWFAADAPRWCVLRVESLFGTSPDGPVETKSVAGIVNGLRAGTRPKVFTDRTVTPSYVPDIAWATRELLERNAPRGLYHCVNSGSCTWYEFAEEIARLLELPADLEPVKLADIKLRAERPLYCALSNARLTNVGIVMPAWQDALRRYLRTFRPEVELLGRQ